MMGRKEAILTMSDAVMKYLVSVQEFIFDRITPRSAGQAWINRNLFLSHKQDLIVIIL